MQLPSASDMEGGGTPENKFVLIGKAQKELGFGDTPNVRASFL